MSDFLERMGALSHERLRLARATLSETQLLQRITGETRTRAIDDDVFEIIAEIKFSTPSAGALASGDTNDVAGRTMDYEHGGAFMISVLTEPSEFGGSLNYLATAHRATSLPILCKDFLIDPYQVLQARAAGADGVLLILKMLEDSLLSEMIAAAHEHGMFVLLEAFDEDDLERAAALANRLNPADMVGLNCRDLRTLEVRPTRFAELAPALPPFPVIAESGVASALAAGTVAQLGYRGALIGSALMAAAHPAETLRKMLRTARAAMIA